MASSKTGLLSTREEEVCDDDGNDDDDDDDEMVKILVILFPQPEDTHNKVLGSGLCSICFRQVEKK